MGRSVDPRALTLAPGRLAAQILERVRELDRPVGVTFTGGMLKFHRVESVWFRRECSHGEPPRTLIGVYNHTVTLAQLREDVEAWQGALRPLTGGRGD